MRVHALLGVGDRPPHFVRATRKTTKALQATPTNSHLNKLIILFLLDVRFSG